MFTAVMHLNDPKEDRHGIVRQQAHSDAATHQYFSYSNTPGDGQSRGKQAHRATL